MVCVYTVQWRTLDKSRFTGYQKHAAKYNWSPCILSSEGATASFASAKMRKSGGLVNLDDEKVFSSGDQHISRVQPTQTVQTVFWRPAHF